MMGRSLSWQTDAIKPMRVAHGVNIGEDKLPRLHLRGRSHNLPMVEVR